MPDSLLSSNDGIKSSYRYPDIKIAFLDVGQGDTIVITCSETQEAIVVDCANAKAVRDYLVEERITQLSGIIVTHLHVDHYCGVSALLEHYLRTSDIKECKVVSFNKNSSKKLRDYFEEDDDDRHSSVGVREKVTALRNLLTWHESNHEKYANIMIQAGVTQLGSYPYYAGSTISKSLWLLHPTSAAITRLETRGLNNTSVVLRVVGPASSALLTGDLEPPGWEELVSNYRDFLRSDVLKFPHHGGGAWKDDDINSLLNVVNPSIVIISVGSDGQRYNHPNSSVFAALSKRPHIRVLCTQATSQCRPPVLNQDVTVRNLLKAEANKSGRKLIGSNRGCPCAGTVIIELKDKAHIIQPNIHFHQESIIKPHFIEHKCNILDDPGKILDERVPKMTAK